MWHRDLWRDSDPWLVDFQASSDEMQKMYSNMNLELNVALKCITIILNGAKDLVRVHANKSKEIA
jgi:DNA-binding protein YbaB